MGSSSAGAVIVQPLRTVYDLLGLLILLVVVHAVVCVGTDWVRFKLRFCTVRVWILLFWA